MTSAKEIALLRSDTRYGRLAKVYLDCYDDAAIGKGEIRHGDDRPFEEQISSIITRLVGLGYPFGQALKKHDEHKKLELEAAIKELRGAINYLAVAIIHLEDA